MIVRFKGLTLKPCPFDGKRSYFHEGEHCMNDIKVVCGTCGVEGPLFDDSYGVSSETDVRANAEAAAKHWNTRK